MKTVSKTCEELLEENERLRHRLEEAEATVEAIRCGEVDAVVVYGSPGERVYTLEGADHPYRLLVEAMRQGVATLNREGMILYCNPYFADLLKTPQERVVGVAGQNFVADADRPVWADMLTRAGTAPAQCEVQLRRGDGLFPAAIHLSPLPFRETLCLLVTDLTQQQQYEELKRSEAVLQERERQLRLVTDNAPVLIAHCDTEGRYKFVNKPYAARLGLEPRDVIGQRIPEVVGERAFATFERHIAEALNGNPVEFEVEVPYRTGTQFMRCAYTPERDANGQVVGLVAAILNITDRKRAEDTLRQQEAIIRAVNDNTSELIFMKDRAGRLTYANAATLRLIGMTAEQALGSLDRDNFTEPAEYLSTAANDRRVVETGQALTIEELYTSPDGQKHVFLSTKSPLRDERGEVIGVVGVSQDITDRKRAEEQLRASEQRLATELEAMTRLHALSTRLLPADNLNAALDDLLENAILTSGADFGNIQVYNPQMGALEIIVQRGFQQDFLDYFRTVRVDEGSACAQAMQSGQRIIIEDVNLDVAFEPHCPVAAAAGYRAVQSTPLKNRSGTVVGMLSTHFRTPHVPSERDRRLLDLCARHAADLIERFRYEQALKDADRRKDEFLATLAHELRNPLAPLRNGLQVMKLARNDGSAVDQARTMMERQLGQMVRLIDDLLDMSRISRGKVELRRERIELLKIIQQAVETSRPLIEENGHDLTIDAPPDPIFVDADATRLAQVFSNLLNNAAKYTERGGHVTLTVERQGSDAVVGVRDTGVGIPAHMLPKVFEMFTQVDRSLERSQGGLGIGLSLVKGLVEMHGGSVEAKSDGHGMGSDFLVRLPVVLSLVGRREEKGDDKATATSGRRILVVDDNRDAALSLAMILKSMGNDTQTAYDGMEALDLGAAFKPDVVLLDIGMPKLNGYEVARRIRQQPWGKNLVLVALTGWGQEEDRRHSQEAGFNLHMVKPVEPAALEKLLADVADSGGLISFEVQNR
jgi:PAS domain S-box-containing protein